MGKTREAETMVKKEKKKKTKKEKKIIKINEEKAIIYEKQIE